MTSRAGAEEIAAAGGLKRSFDQVIAQADYLCIHTPGTPENYHLFNQAVFRRMKMGACLVNVARGSVLCEEDLAAALRSGHLACAALDVFEEEPLPPESPLRQMDQVLLTPHAAWYSASSQRLLQRKAAQQVRAVLEGRRPECLVNEEVAENVFPS